MYNFLLVSTSVLTCIACLIQIYDWIATKRKKKDT